MAIVFPKSTKQTLSQDPKHLSSKSTSQASFMMSGSSAQEALQKAEAESELRKLEAGKAFRFFIPKGAERSITFLDGNLNEFGVLEPVFKEHTIKVSGSWSTYICTEAADTTQPCPLCESGSYPAIVGALTVIDHTPYTIQSGKNQGKIIANTRKLFVAKMTTITILTSLSKKRGGLAGCRFDVTRVGDNAPNVGSNFDFVSKKPLGEIAQEFNLSAEEVAPLNYAEELVYITPAELIKLGLGKAHTGVGYTKTPASASLIDEL